MAKFKCSKCDRKFSMPAHLARHMSASHGVKKKRSSAKKAKRRGRPPGRRTGKAARGRRGRPSSLGARLGLRNMNLDQLIEVIDAARGEAHRKIEAFREVF
jgi:hypothetical protein